jgi:transglutaminase-like putative cysteine protease
MKMIADDRLLAATPILNFDHPSIARLVEDSGWKTLSKHDRVGAVYDFVRNEIAFGYNLADNISAADVLADGYGQCNTKGPLLMALLRAVGVTQNYISQKLALAAVQQFNEAGSLYDKEFCI